MAWLLPPLTPTFEAALRDVRGKRPESRMAAAERLGHAEQGEREAALDGLCELARDPHAGVRATAMAALGMLGAEDRLDVVVAGMTDAFPEVREFAAMAAAQIGGNRALAALRDALSHASPEVRFQAVSAVLELDPEAAGRDLLPLLADEDPAVRAHTLSALSSLEQPHLCGHFAGALDDEAFSVRLEAALALAACDDVRGEAVLLEALTQRARLPEATEALGRLGSQRAREPLATIALSFLARIEHRAAAAAALVRLGDGRGVEVLRGILVGWRSATRSYAVELARDLGAESLVKPLARLARRPRGTDLITLVSTLQSYATDYPEARDALKHLAARPDADEVGQAARRALAALPVKVHG